jgi:geranylgeranyl reductase family protein
MDESNFRPIKTYKMNDQLVTIIGAGPAGSSAALQLDRLGIPSLVIDKAGFPRQKTCGDAVSGKVLTVLNRIDPAIYQRLISLEASQPVWGMRLLFPNRVKLDLPFKWNYDALHETAPGAVVPRDVLDHFLVEEVKKSTHCTLLEEMEITRVERTQNGFILSDRNGKIFIKTKVLLVANGANSPFTRQLAGIRKENRYFAGAVRAYYENVEGFHPDGFIELHFLKEYVPGYFWIFPVQGNRANVGLGLRSDYISKRKLNLRKSLLDIVDNYPGIRERFSHAKRLSEIQGHPLPLGSKRYRISGDGFMLLGDAGHLIDPLTGEGIGHAIYSGWIAAEQIAHCLKTDRFDAGEMINYDKRIQRVMGVELRLSHRMQQLMRFQPLVNTFADRIARNEKLQSLLTRMYSDLELRKKLVDPLFLLKILTGRI